MPWPCLEKIRAWVAKRKNLLTGLVGVVVEETAACIPGAHLAVKIVGEVAKHGVDGVYDSDPKHNPVAAKYLRLTYEEAITADIRIMDTSAFVLANEQALTMHVFDVAAAGVMREICQGAELGTRISVK